MAHCDVSASAFYPTTVFYITPHNSFHRHVRVYQVHRSVGDAACSTVDDLLRSSVKSSKSIDGKEVPALTLLQGGIFWGNGQVYNGAFVGEEESKHNVVGAWKPCRIVHGTNIFTFGPPDDSEEAKRIKSAKGGILSQYRHPITLRRTTIITSRSEFFVKDSVKYVWRFDDKMNDMRMTLYAQSGGTEEIVAKAYRPWHIENTGGCVALDENKIDALTVVLTTVGMWRKLRLRTHR